MSKKLSVRTASDYAFVDGHPMYDATNQLLIKLMGTNNRGEVEISPLPFAHSKKATLEHDRQGVHIYSSSDGSFTICKSKVKQYELGKQFHYKIK